MGLVNATGIWTGAAQQSTPDFNAGKSGETTLLPGDMGILRDLAEGVAGLAQQREAHEKRLLWTAHNDLDTTYPVVFADPENGWNEVITDAQLLCSGSLARRWECVLRKELYWGNSIRDDKVTEPYFDVGYSKEEDDWGVSVEQRGGDGGAYAWTGRILDERDLDILKKPEVKIDYPVTRETVQLAEEVFGDILTVRLIGSWWWSIGMTVDLAKMIGLEKFMYDLVDNPGFLHSLMKFLMNGYLDKLEYLEKGALLSSNTDLYVGSGGFGYTKQLPSASEERKVRLQHMWGFSESQETVGISPDMFAEFIFPYQLEILKKFGLNCYGCCEPLDKRWHIIKNIPNLRRVSVSAWADSHALAELLGNQYVYSYKPLPSVLAYYNIDEDLVRKGLRTIVETAKGCCLEIIMKDNHTLGNNPGNLTRWVEIAREEISAVHD